MTTKRDLLVIAEHFLEAVTHNRPEQVPGASSLRSTYNGVAGPLGAGNAWGDAVRAPAKQTFVDPEQGNIAFFGVLANSTPVHGSVREKHWFYTFRLKVVGGLVTESEEIAFDGKWAHYSVQPGDVEVDPRFEALLPEDERSTREEMIALVDTYWRAAGRLAPASTVSFHPDARRTEIGQVTTDAWNFPLTPRGDFANEGWEWTLKNIRYPVIDVERGVLVSFLAMDVNEKSNPLFGPSIASEVFKIENGLLRRLFAMYYPGTSVDGWGS